MPRLVAAEVASDPDLVTLLINAIYFHGSWTTQFDPAKTGRQAVQREDGSTVQVDRMNRHRQKQPHLKVGLEEEEQFPWQWQALL